ncbi:hypothetical protein [Pseudomonas palleroniana]|uniref:hypothetical protein n=1 Tax=Pseudomonas palleroniana TaxID=191390 RepID=UPI0018E68561|nr:hypothetical protein [Pseudomonas palleroniana]MBI6910334.1 hypothetical protein [Pseudomonas palleroniana]
MIIREIGREEPVKVFGIYWIENERFYWVIPYDGYCGLMALSDREVNVVDSSLSSDLILCKDGGGRDMILHWAAEDLIEELVERDPLAMVEFLERIKG